MKHIELGSKRMMRACALSAAPREACGVLVDEYGNGRLTYVPSMNQSADPLSYIIDPEVQRKYIGRIEAVFHSHVAKDACPSDVDGVLAVEGMVYVIYSLLTDEFQAWRRVRVLDPNNMTQSASPYDRLVWQEEYEIWQTDF